MFNAGSMFHRLNKPNFRLFIVLSLMFQKGTRPHVDAQERIGELSSFGFKATFGRARARSVKILQDIE